ncbi:olfactory receptor 1052-like [Hyla sarda]|uniref:olfactory receptor 1052-like n=1 Tax=Hyla sarda TaxID=327740 RepID=UPI0024C44C9B|nr:olfactory receptor 1052-like [Hyla sarda]
MTYNENNQTTTPRFVLLGLTDNNNLRCFLFILFFLVYIIVIVGNSNIILLFQLSPSLQTPMYFFLSHLAFSDLCYSSVITPKLLDILLAGDTSLSYGACMCQLIFFSVFGSLESLILALMSCDRCVAVSRPLLYYSIMTTSVCRRLIASCYTVAILTSILNTSYALQLSFCGPVNIPHFYCDYPPLLKLSCSDTYVNELVLLFSVAMVSGISVVTIMTSYGYIIHIAVGIRSTEGRCKVFYTCSSHLTVVFMFYGTILFMYLRPSAQYFSEQDKVVAIFYTVVIPALNPIIYSLRNKELQTAVTMIIGRKCMNLYIYLLILAKILD